MFWGMIEGGVSHQGLQLLHRIEPLPVLNEWALDAQLEVTAMSFNTYRSRHLQYRPLAPGVSWGHGYGPKIIFQTTEPDPQRDVLAVPGRGSTAALLAQRFGWTGPFLELAYTELMQAVELGRAQRLPVAGEGGCRAPRATLTAPTSWRRALPYFMSSCVTGCQAGSAGEDASRRQRSASQRAGPSNSATSPRRSTAPPKSRRR